MASIGDKFIIEISGKENHAYPYPGDGYLTNYSIKGSGIKLSERVLEGLEKYIEPQNGDVGFDTGYRKGLADAWELVKKIYEKLPCREVEKIFGNSELGWILSNNNAAEAMEIIKAYEEKIEIGDEVRHTQGDKIGVVTKKAKNGENCGVLFSDGGFVYMSNYVLQKTGRHFPQIAKVLEQLKGKR